MKKTGDIFCAGTSERRVRKIRSPIKIRIHEILIFCENACDFFFIEPAHSFKSSAFNKGHLGVGRRGVPDRRPDIISADICVIFGTYYI